MIMVLAMELQTTLIYSESLIKKAVLSFWWRVVGIKFMIAIGLTSFGFFFSLSGGDRSWLAGLFATTLFFAIAVIVALYFVHYRNSLQKLKAMGDPRAEFTLSDDSFSVSSGGGSATLPWSSVDEVWQFPDYWLFFFSKSHFSTFPVQNLSPEIQAFITERINDAGGKIS